MPPARSPRRPARPSWLFAAALATTLLIGSTGSASAYQVLETTGAVGPYTMTDTSATPGAKCAYERVSPDFEYFRSMWVRAPRVLAADRKPNKRDSRIVSWRVVLQKNVGPGFSAVGKSRWQRARAYENKPAALTGTRVFYDSTAMDGFVAEVWIRWHGLDGSVEGRVRLRVQHYGMAGDTAFTFADECPGGFQYV